MVLQLRSGLLNLLLQESVQANQGYADTFGIQLVLDCTPEAATALGEAAEHLLGTVRCV